MQHNHKPEPEKAIYDDLDLMLVNEMEANARQTTRELAARLGTSATTISNRLRRLIEDEVISFAAMVRPNFLGFDARIILGLKITPGKSTDVAKELAGFKNIQTISLTTGRYDMILYALFRNYPDLLDWMSDELSQFPHVITVEVMTSLKSVKNIFLQEYDGGDNALDQAITPRSLDETEIKLIRELELSPRESIGGLGKKVGMSRQTTAKKLKVLMEEKAVRVVSIADLSVFGFAAPAYIFLRVTLDRIVPVANALATDDRITHVTIITGRFNLVFYVTFLDMQEMNRFLTEELGNIPGVVDQETMIQVGRSYYSFRLTE